MSSPLASWDKKFLWHPFTQQAEWEKRDPIIIHSANGVWLKDVRGKKLLDGNSSLWVNVWGHNHPVLNRALEKQLHKIAHSTFLGLTHEPAIRLAKALVDIAPKGLSRVFYSDNGSTAVEVALKMTYQYWQLKGKTQKKKFVSLKDGYHGDTVGSVSVGGIDLFHKRFKGLLFDGWQVGPSGAVIARTTSAGRRTKQSVVQKERLLRFARNDSLSEIFSRHHQEIAAVIMEPLIQGASGMLLQPKGFLKEVSRLCKKYDILLILDEVATGFGRTGTMFACEQEDVSPDFLCVAKSITGGYLPLAATLTSEKVYRMFLGRYEEFRHFFHGHTYTANPLACAVALANLALYRKKNLLRNIQARARQLKEGLRPLQTHPAVKDIRQIGLMCGIELRGKGRMGQRACDAAIKRGVWLRPLGNVVVLMPPLAITEREMAFLIKNVVQVLNAVRGPERRSRS